MDYGEFLAGKQCVDAESGFSVNPDDINPMLFDFQQDIVRWSLRRGRAAIFADCGLGKTPMQLEWARHIPGRVLIVAPLAVSQQTIREGEKFGVEVTRSQDGTITDSGITITNYERLHHFNPADFDGIVLDESSILKSYTGKYRTDLIERWGNIKYRLACTATPAPNDYMELGNHAEFIGAMRGSEMLAAFFINDAAHVGHYRIKGHAETAFWQWLASWSVMIRRPSDLGYVDGNFTLPPCEFVDVQTDSNKPADGMLFALEANTMTERRAARKATIDHRVDEVARLANSNDECWMVWCDLNPESKALAKKINGAVEVKGADSDDHKMNALLGFANGDFRVLVSKPSIAGWGMNYQHCHNVAFTGLSDSYEQFYQAVRRCWRFGQKHTVKCYVVTDRTEGAVVNNVRRKEAEAVRMAENMAKHMAYISRGEIKRDVKFAKSYNAGMEMETPKWLHA